MALIRADRVLETSTSTGTGNFALGGAVAGYRDFDSVCANNDTIYYCIEAVNGIGAPSGEWEVGLGTFNDADTLVRTSVLASSNSNAAVNFSAGTKRVFAVDPGDASSMRSNLGLGTIATQAANNVAITGGSVTGITDLALADGGTGASLADPNADRIMFWDDSAGSVAWLTAGTGLTITDTTIAASGGSGTDLFDEEKEYRSAMGIGGSNVPQQNGIALATTGSASSVLVTDTSFATSRYRSARTTGLSSGTSAGFRDPEFKLFRRHGFKVAIRFVVETISGADMRIFAGLTSETLLTNQDPSSHNHVLGFGLDSADSNFQRMENDAASGTATKTDTGIALAAGEMFEAVIECAAGGDPSLMLYHWGSANTTPTPTATYGPATVTTDIPSTTQQLFPYIWWNNAATAAAAICSVVSIRIWA